MQDHPSLVPKSAIKSHISLRTAIDKKIWTTIMKTSHCAQLLTAILL